MVPETRFSSELDQVSELPEPLANVVWQHLTNHEVVSLLIHKPTEVAATEVSPPKVLAVTERGFIFVEKPDDEPAEVMHCSFDSVLLVELATLLLYGHLRIDFVENAQRRSVAMEYNSVAHELYRRAATLILDGASSSSTKSAVRPQAVPLDTSNWPTSLRVAAEFGMLSPTPLYTAAWWPSVRGGFALELAPAGVLLAREDRLTVVLVEQSGPWDRVRAKPTFGYIATYLPAGRLFGFNVHPSPKLSVFNLEMHSHHGGEQFQLAVPPDREISVRRVIEDVLSRSR